jgi:hypothetical protein
VIFVGLGPAEGRGDRVITALGLPYTKLEALKMIAKRHGGAIVGLNRVSFGAPCWCAFFVPGSAEELMMRGP